MKPTELLVLAGGFGTRLRTAVADVPKPLAPVASRPYLYYLIQAWVAQGVRSFTFLLHYQAEMIESFLDTLGEENWFEGCTVRALREPEPLGTGGALAYAVRIFGIKQSFVVANADTWLGGGFDAISSVPAPAIAIVEVPDCSRYGSVEVSDGRVFAFREKSSMSVEGWINAGLYHLSPTLFEHWQGQAMSLERDILPDLVRSGALRSVALTTTFIDIGIPDDYFRFCRWIESEKIGVL